MSYSFVIYLVYVTNDISFIAVAWRITRKLNVYSFGVFSLTELITGHKAVDKKRCETCHQRAIWFMNLVDEASFAKVIDQTVEACLIYDVVIRKRSSGIQT